MSLVDYASSSDDEVSDSEHEPSAPPPRPPLSPPKTQVYRSSSANQKPETLEKLPDASMLLNYPTVSLASENSHASLVAAAVAQSRKRDSKGMVEMVSSGSVPPPPRAKLPRSTIPHSKSVPDTRGGALVPPQLRGRSNVVTEDISKLFVRKHAVEQPRGPEN